MTEEQTFPHWLDWRGWLRRAGLVMRYYLIGLYNRVDRNHDFLAAAGLAFSLFVCVIPLILLAMAVVGIIFEQPEIVEDISVLIDRAIPYQAYADYVKEVVLARVAEFRGYKSVAGILGTVGILLAASGLFSSLRTILNRVFRVATGEPIWIGKLRDLGLILLVLLFFLLTTLLLPAWDIARGLADQWDFLEELQVGAAWNFLFEFLSYLLTMLTFAAIYFFVPYRRPPKRIILFSAAWSAFLWLIAQQLFGVYITYVVTLRQIYGAYFLLIVVAFWVYYTAFVCILGAEIGQLFRERRLASRRRRASLPEK